MRRGEVWLINLDPTVGAEITKADTFQVRSVAQERFVRRLGELSATAMQKIARALAVVLAIDT